jgi:hypothetical protein
VAVVGEFEVRAVATDLAIPASACWTSTEVGGGKTVQASVASPSRLSSSSPASGPPSLAASSLVKK